MAASILRLNDGRHLLTGCTLSPYYLRVGQEWASVEGNTVFIEEIDKLPCGDVIVTYSGPSQPRHSKPIFAFQCRYSLVLPVETEDEWRAALASRREAMLQLSEGETDV